MSGISFRKGTSESIPVRIWDEATPRQRVNPDNVTVFAHNLPAAPVIQPLAGWDGQIVFSAELSASMAPDKQYWLSISYTKGDETKATGNYPVSVFE